MVATNLRPEKGNVLLRWHCQSITEIGRLFIDKSFRDR